MIWRGQDIWTVFNNKFDERNKLKQKSIIEVNKIKTEELRKHMYLQINVHAMINS